MNAKEIRMTPTVEELNDIQREWMALDSLGPKTEIERVCRLMKRLPSTYISGHDGKYNVVVGGMPFFAQNQTLAQALETCGIKYGGRVDIAWNGRIGVWYSLNH